jgi:hypothetical protein
VRVSECERVRVSESECECGKRVSVSAGRE